MGASLCLLKINNLYGSEDVKEGIISIKRYLVQPYDIVLFYLFSGQVFGLCCCDQTNLPKCGADRFQLICLKMVFSFVLFL